MPSPLHLLIVVGVLWMIEALVTCERPTWLLPLALLRLEHTRRFMVPARRRPVDATLADQSDATIHAWLRLSVRAITLERTDDGEATLPDPEDARSIGYASMIDSLPADERDAYRTRLFPEHQTRPRACESFHATSEGLRRLPPRQRARMLRALAAP